MSEQVKVPTVKTTMVFIVNTNELVVVPSIYEIPMEENEEVEDKPIKE